MTWITPLECCGEAYCSRVRGDVFEPRKTRIARKGALVVFLCLVPVVVFQSVCTRHLNHCGCFFVSFVCFVVGHTRRKGCLADAAGGGEDGPSLTSLLI